MKALFLIPALLVLSACASPDKAATARADCQRDVDGHARGGW